MENVPGEITKETKEEHAKRDETTGQQCHYGLRKRRNYQWKQDLAWKKSNLLPRVTANFDTS